MTGSNHHHLSNVRVLDASRILAGPFCGQLLGDLGANVIKIERPGRGDDTREWGPPFLGPFSAYYLSCNRNKHSVAVDLKHEGGRALFHRLAKSSDILLENFLPDSAAKLGADPETLHRIHPQLIICSISGYGRNGPLADIPGYDNAVQARSGLMSITGPAAGPPYKVGVALTDVLTGLYAATAVLACLHARKESARGYHIDLALLDCALASQVNVAQAYLTTGEVPPRQGNEHLQIVPYQAFSASDGWLVLTVGNDAQFQRFCQAAQRPDLGGDDRYQTNRGRVENRHLLIPQLESMFATKTVREWQSLLEQHNVPHAPVWDYAQLFAQDQIAARNMRVQIYTSEGDPVDLLGSPFHINGEAMHAMTAPPELGRDTDDVLRRILNVDDVELARLRSTGAIG